MAALPSQSMDFGAATTAVTDVRTTSGDIETIGTKVQTGVTTLMSNDWKGTASTSYESAYQKWHQGLVQVYTNLTWLSDQMESTNMAAEDNEATLDSQNASFEAPDVLAY